MQTTTETHTEKRNGQYCAEFLVATKDLYGICLYKKIFRNNTNKAMHPKTKLNYQKSAMLTNIMIQTTKDGDVAGTYVDKRIFGLRYRKHKYTHICPEGEQNKFFTKR